MRLGMECPYCDGLLLIEDLVSIDREQGIVCKCYHCGDLVRVVFDIEKAG